MVPGLKFSMRTSLLLTSFRRMARPSSLLMSSAMLRLSRLYCTKYGLSSFTVVPHRLESSPWSGASILMTSAPISPRRAAHSGPATAVPSSKTLTPSRGPVFKHEWTSRNLFEFSSLQGRKLALPEQLFAKRSHPQQGALLEGSGDYLRADGQAACNPDRDGDHREADDVEGQGQPGESGVDVNQLSVQLNSFVSNLRSDYGRCRDDEEVDAFHGFKETIVDLGATILRVDVLYRADLSAFLQALPNVVSILLGHRR